MWLGAGRTLLRVSDSTGAVLARTVLPTGLDLTDLETGPGGKNLHASGSPSTYGGGALWAATAGGLVACLNPVTGTARAQGTLTSRPALIVVGLAADPRLRELAAVISTASYTGMVTISPPRACWN